MLHNELGLPHRYRLRLFVVLAVERARSQTAACAAELPLGAHPAAYPFGFGVS